MAPVMVSFIYMAWSFESLIKGMLLMLVFWVVTPCFKPQQSCNIPHIHRILIYSEMKGMNMTSHEPKIIGMGVPLLNARHMIDTK
jgi:hypothetical protein